MSLPPSTATGFLPVSEQIPLLSLLEEALELGARLAAYDEPRAAITGHVQSFLPRAASAAPSLFHPAALSRRIGLAAIRSALEAGYDEVLARAQAGARRAHVEVGWVTHRAREICATLVSSSTIGSESGV
jgi:hypothetical protein